MTKKNNTLDFESDLNELEKIVDKLEGGKLNLTDSISFFEKGIGLYKNCKKQLEKAEKKISVLTDSLKEEEYKK